MERNDNNVPNYIAYETNRIDNYHLLLDSYVSEYCSAQYCTSNHVENQLLKTACANPNICLSCIYSRLNEQDRGYLQRVCSLGFEFEKDECKKISEYFNTKVNRRLK